MNIRSRLMASVVLSLLVSTAIAGVAFFILRSMKAELERSRVYDEIITKANAFNVLLATLKDEANPSDLHQMRNVQASLAGLLDDMSSMDAPERSLVEQIRKQNQELGLLLDQIPAPGAGGRTNLDKERKDILGSQLWMKVRYISDDTFLLRDTSRSRLVSAQAKAGITVFSLLVMLIFSNTLISVLSGRSVVSAEKALREQREWLKVTLTSIGDAVLATDSRGKVTFLNPAAAALTGWENDEASGQRVENVFRIINERSREPADNIIDRVLKEGRTVGLANHTALLTPDGREISIEDSAAPIRDGGGEILGVVLVFHDVTERRRVQEALRVSEERLRLAFRGAACGAWELDLATGKSWWSPELFELWGVEPGTPREPGRYFGTDRRPGPGVGPQETGRRRCRGAGLPVRIPDSQCASR